MSSHVTVDRLQFTLTVTFHYLFPIATMGTALFVAWLKTVAYLGGSHRRLGPLWWLAVVLVAAAGWATYGVREQLVHRFGDHPWRLVPLAITMAAVAAAFLFRRAGAWRRAFLASCVVVGGLLATTAAGLYPDLLPAPEGHPFGLTVHNAASSDHALRTALFWWPVGMTLAVAYFTLAYRQVLRRAP